MKVATNNGHDALVGSVIHVACHGGPLGDTFDMVGHDPSMLKIPAGLHTPNQVVPTTKADLGHLENKNFVRIVTLVWELIPLDIGPGDDTSKLGDAIHNSSPTSVFEGDNFVSEMGGIQLFATIKNGLKFFQRMKLMRIIIIAEEELTHKVLVGFTDDFAMSGLGRSFNVLLNEGVNALAAFPAVANLDGVTMIVHMNAGSMGGVIVVDVECFGVA